MPQSRPNNLTHLHRDRGYRWNDRDPDLEFITDKITKSHLSSYQIAQEIARLSGGAASVSHQTIDKWLNGKTRRPSNWTLTWVAAALGLERRWIVIGGKK